MAVLPGLPRGEYLFSARCARGIIGSAAVSAAATSAGSGAWDFPDSRRWRTLLRPRMRALRLVRAATACERFRLTGKMPAATLNTYRGEGESSAVFRPYRGRPLEKTFYCTAAGIW